MTDAFETAERGELEPNSKHISTHSPTYEERIEALTAEIERKDAALLEISGYELLKVSGFHEYSTFGAATGREYKHKIPILAEDSFSIAKRMQSIARAALQETEQ